LQRPKDQEAAETEEHLDAELAEILPIAAYGRFRKASKVEVMAE
jgi:hypothetical protein